LDRAKTTFFSNISHEFRTPLTLMLGPLEDLLDHAELQVEKEQLTLIHRNALRLYKLVNSLLDFSRLEDGRARANFEAVSLGRLTQDLASIFRSATERYSPLPQPPLIFPWPWRKH
jgi:signal transduction histidine kinase